MVVQQLIYFIGSDEKVVLLAKLDQLLAMNFMIGQTGLNRVEKV